MDSVTVTIDGRQVSVPKGMTVLQAAIEHGIQVPYYCYHPALGVDGSCRVCIVKIEKMPKLQTACSTICADGMIVQTRTPDVIEARASVFEFLLINHPLDCPVCDKGGECPLQDFSYTFGPAESRMDFPRRVFDGEGVRADVDFGPTLMLNRNRCILCTRCIRFMRDIDGDAQIGITDRGYGTEIATFEERGVHSLLSGNLMDVCPVGAILTKDYRFKSRPWDNPQAVDTICTLCSKGCNTTAWIKAKPEWAKGARLIRFTPRLNPAVNGYWMCDIGRFDYHWIEGADRLRRPLARDESGAQQPVTWHDALHDLAASVAEAGTADARSVRFLVSAHASLEELFVVQRLAREFVGEQSDELIAVSWRYREKVQPAATTFRVPAVDAPNVTGARDLGLSAGDSPEPARGGSLEPAWSAERGTPARGGGAPRAEREAAERAEGAPPSAENADLADVSQLRGDVEAGRVRALYVLDPGPAGSIGDVAWIAAARRSGALPLLVVQGLVTTELTHAADFVLPGASWVEKEASYTNNQGRVQAAARALPPPGDAREDWRILVDVARVLGVALPYESAASIRADIAVALGGNAEYAGLAALASARPVAAQTWLQVSNPSERWKWDFMFQDVPPVKGDVVTASLPIIPVKEIT